MTMLYIIHIKPLRKLCRTQHNLTNMVCLNLFYTVSKLLNAFFRKIVNIIHSMISHRLIDMLGYPHISVSTHFRLDIKVFMY